MTLTAHPITLKDANAFVIRNHRHNGKVAAHRFAIACYDGERLCGVAIVGNPVARGLQDGFTVEVRRCCTDGTPNACSFLYGRCARAARELGFRRIVTYLLESEMATTMKASGWKIDGKTDGGTWDTPARRRDYGVADLFGEYLRQYEIKPKIRYIKEL